LFYVHLTNDVRKRGEEETRRRGEERGESGGPVYALDG
jgi:hypothetical protein